jgi:hypothetical protein
LKGLEGKRNFEGKAPLIAAVQWVRDQVTIEVAIPVNVQHEVPVTGMAIHLRLGKQLDLLCAGPVARLKLRAYPQSLGEFRIMLGKVEANIWLV